MAEQLPVFQEEVMKMSTNGKKMKTLKALSITMLAIGAFSVIEKLISEFYIDIYIQYRLSQSASSIIFIIYMTAAFLIGVLYIASGAYGLVKWNDADAVRINSRICIAIIIVVVLNEIMFSIASLGFSAGSGTTITAFSIIPAAYIFYAKEL